MESVLSTVTRRDVVRNPFPHILLEGAIDEETCRRLVQEFPPLEVVTQGRPFRSNKRFSYPAVDVLRNARISAVWRDLVAAHVSQAFLVQFLDVFGDSIRGLYPAFERDIGALGTLRAGIRRLDTFETADVLLDAQPSVNTPVTGEPTAVRGGHVDNPTKLFAGMLYLRRPDDDSVGGDLELYRFRRGRFTFTGAEIEARYIERVRTIRYERNVLVLFVNSLHSLHGVSVRSRTSMPRLFLNLVGEVKRPLFDLRRHQRGRLSALALRAARRLVHRGG